MIFTCVLTRGRPIICIKMKLIGQVEEELWMFKGRKFFSQKCVMLSFEDE